MYDGNFESLNRVAQAFVFEDILGRRHKPRKSDISGGFRARFSVHAAGQKDNAPSQDQPPQAFRRQGRYNRDLARKLITPTCPQDPRLFQADAKHISVCAHSIKDR